MKRETLTKSLHTVTAVSLLAQYLIDQGYKGVVLTVKVALRILGHDGYDVGDPTFDRCVEATKKLLS